MAIQAQPTTIYVLDRNTFTRMTNEGTILTNGIYFIRETNSVNAKIVSLNVGQSKQCDVLDISDVQNIDFNDPAHNYNIPIDYRVKDKLLFYTQTGPDNKKYYRTLMWNGSKFLDCLGGSLSEPDGITIKKNSQGTLSGVGSSQFNVTSTIDGTTYTGKQGSEIFNYVFDEDEDSDIYKHNNVATNLYGSAFGVANVNMGIASSAFNIGDIGNIPSSIYDMLSGYSVPSGFSYSGIANNSLACNSFGASNNVSGKFNTALGIYNNIGNSAEYTILYGHGLTKVTSGNSAIFGKYNYDDVSIIFSIGNGTDSTHRSNAFSITQTGNATVQGNVTVRDGVTVASLIQDVSAQTDADDNPITLGMLPKNSAEQTLGASTLVPGTYRTITSVKISNITQTTINTETGSQTAAVPRDYSSVIIFKKSSSTTSPDSLMDNFTGVNDAPIIYLLNPTVDITNATIIHIMLFNDGFNICAIVAGYEEQPPV